MRTLSAFKVLSFASLGHGIELYNFAMFGVMLPILAPTFFPHSDAISSILLGYIAFAITFLVSPLGSIFWARYADKFGRARLMRNSLILMGIPSITIAFLPSYDQIGIVAPIILLILRVIQGLSASGEVIGAKMFAMEYLGAKKYGIASGYISAAGAIGVLLAMLVAFIALDTNNELVWRSSFLIGSLLFLSAAWIRRNFNTKRKEQNSKSPANKITFFQIIKQYPHHCAVTFMLGALLGIMSYFMHVFINPYLVLTGLEKSFVYSLSGTCLLATALSAIFAGILIDRHASLKIMAYVPTILYSLMSYLVLNCEAKFLHIVFATFGFALGFYATTAAVLMYKCFPEELKNRGIMINYAIGISIFGGLTPVTLNLLASYHGNSISTITAFTLATLLYFLHTNLKKTKLI